MKTKLLLLLFLCSFAGMAQQRKSLKGRVTVAEASLSGAFVINKATGQEVTTDAQGLFSLPARKGDKIVVYSTKIETREFFITDDAFKNMPYAMAVTAKAFDLDEVVVTDTVSIVQPVSGRAAAYSPGERRANIGAETKLHTLDHLGGGVAVPLDAVFNGSEKRKQLRRELKTEQLQKNIDGISAIYSNDQITSYLGIPEAQIDAFLYYAAEDVVISNALKEKNTEMVKMQLSEVAIEYTGLQQEEEVVPITSPQNKQ
jgi:hypothetical protein